MMSRSGRLPKSGAEFGCAWRSRPRPLWRRPMTLCRLPPAGRVLFDVSARSIAYHSHRIAQLRELISRHHSSPHGKHLVLGCSQNDVPIAHLEASIGAQVDPLCNGAVAVVTKRHLLILE